MPSGKASKLYLLLIHSAITTEFFSNLETLPPLLPKIYQFWCTSIQFILTFMCEQLPTLLWSTLSLGWSL